MIGELSEIWDKTRVYVIGGGPSVKSFNPELLRDKKVIVTNNAYKLFPWAHVLYFMDCSWYKWNKHDLHNFTGLKITTCNECKDLLGFIYLQHGVRNGVDMRPGFLSRGATSGQGAVNIGIKLGAVEIILATGFDMRVVDGQHNYHTEHKRTSPLPPNIYADHHMKSFRVMAPIAKEMGITIINCTPNSAIDFLPNEPIEKWL